jgi:hypothetical protein
VVVDCRRGVRTPANANSAERRASLQLTAGRPDERFRQA